MAIGRGAFSKGVGVQSLGGSARQAPVRSPTVRPCSTVGALDPKAQASKTRQAADNASSFRGRARLTESERATDIRNAQQTLGSQCAGRGPLIFKPRTSGSENEQLKMAMPSGIRSPADVRNRSGLGVAKTGRPVTCNAQQPMYSESSEFGSPLTDTRRLNQTALLDRQ